MAEPVVVNQAIAVSSGSAASVTTSGVTTTSGNLVVVAVAAFSNIIGATPITDNKSNTWNAAITSFGATEGWLALFYAENITGGAAHTFTFTPSSSGFIAIAVIEIENMPTSSSLNHTATATGTGSTLTAGPITADAGIREIMVGAAALSDAGCSYPLDTLSAIKGFNFRHANAGANNEGIIIAWTEVDDGDSRSFTAFRAVGDNDSVCIAGFKAADPAPGGGETSHAYAG